ncbi:hypothetical protein AUR04nite_28530 [Glutamicibacter uratoxydans]|uniref:HTH tetR-type domain-containing protein n=1 Tax=Glutamicibacter uratoxydans TaxID=43667 RepID=A0A4Y4DY72_GLUUR|nr:TetR family transcriptional regulator [Glutamicibacter uratoxydans]GED07321.1 hypothetical protein AUR04nite_28530 [Glutamicibacter uratoxydans]
MGSEETSKPRVDRVLDAALNILAEQGLRAVSHARIDKRALLPLGSTSNYFRTRQALLEGLIAHLARLEREDFANVPPQEARIDAEAAFTQMLELQSGIFRNRTLARYALFIDLASTPDLMKPLLENRKGFELWTTATLAALGASDPLSCTTFLMATLDGALLHRISVDPEMAIEPVVHRALAACLDNDLK